MARRLLVLAAVVLLTQSGCRSRCDGRRGFFTGHGREPAPCQTVGRGETGCFDASTGQPVPCPTGGVAMPAPAFPGLGPNPRLEELPPPNPSNLIPNPAVPIPAPPSGEASLPFPTSPGTPVKVGPK
jgi:hypothetical protein